MSDKKPFFSLVLPTKDRPELVLHCLAALKAQTFADFEVIVSDNGNDRHCDKLAKCYAFDARFKFVRPEANLSMCDNWDFAVGFAKGNYISVLCEKFILRPDALELLYEAIARTNADVVTWQFERFEVDQIDETNIYGHYHPLMKPQPIREYCPQQELKRRFDFIEPLFFRTHRHKNSYGKLYSGCVKAELLNNIRLQYGRLFHPYAPDFSSMVAILNESKVCIDVAQSLMLVLFADGYSNGEATQVSLAATERYILSYEPDLDHFKKRLVLPSLWVGHSALVAADYQLIKSMATYGILPSLTMNQAALYVWVWRDYQLVTDFAQYDSSTLSDDLQRVFTNFTEEEQHFIKQEISTVFKPKPCNYEIYHSGLIQNGAVLQNVTAEQLALLHWQENVAPLRKNITTGQLSVSDALTYFYQYSLASNRLLGLN